MSSIPVQSPYLSQGNSSLPAVKSSLERRSHSTYLRLDPASTMPLDTDLRFVDEISSQLTLAVQTHDGQRAQELIDRLFVECNRLRHGLTTSDWKDCVERLRRTDILTQVHQDAFTYRAFSKPRGYAGDAVMMDMIYSLEEGYEQPEMSPIGQQVFRYTTQAAASAGVRARREYIAELLDQFLYAKQQADVLAVASGHLREASMSSAVRRQRFGSYVAMDADAKSLEQVNDSYGRLGVETHPADIRKMLTGNLELGQFDLIYSTGLYDYLNEKTAQRLTYHLFHMLRPKGKLVVANFVPGIPDIGYMEACMDWFLIYRDRFEMLGLTKLIHQELIADIRVCVEENQNIIFLEVTRG
jgi:extracellular factor (EF) 3-hydroxypalmitic acid methyl ester biosynthesis protein